MPLFGGFAQARNFGKGGAGRPPGFITPSGSLGTLKGGGGNAAGLLSAAAQTGPGDPPIQSYSIVSGSLPGGLSFNTSTAAITGTASSVSSETTYNFTVRATSSAGNIDRAFSITIRLPILAAFTSTGNQTWNVPSGVSDCEVLVIGAGGSGGNIGGGGGAGGVVLATAYPVTPGGSVPMNIGTPGGPYYGSYPPGNAGGQTTFGSITAYGGGLGGGYSNTHQGGSGGSSGGGAHGPSYPSQPASQPGFSMSGRGPYTNYGNAGGPGAYPIGNGTHSGGGGGGAGGAGQAWQQGYPYGGSGAYFPQFSSYGTPGGHFAAGGGGGGWSGHIYGPGSGGTGGGGAGGYNGGGSNASGHGSGSGAGGHPAPSGSTGSPGAVFIRY